MQCFFPFTIDYFFCYSMDIENENGSCWNARKEERGELVKVWSESKSKESQEVWIKMHSMQICKSVRGMRRKAIWFKKFQILHFWNLQLTQIREFVLNNARNPKPQVLMKCFCVINWNWPPPLIRDKVRGPRGRKLGSNRELITVVRRHSPLVAA